MKYITEEELRDAYKKRPFTIYEIGTGISLTPAARQFLVDRRVHMHDVNSRMDDIIPTWSEKHCLRKKEADIKNTTAEYSAAPKSASAMSPVTGESEVGMTDVVLRRKFFYRVRKLEVEFLLTSQELMPRDLLLAQKLLELVRYLSELKKIPDGFKPDSALFCRKCDGIDEETCSCYLGDCFDITEFHLQLPNAQVILAMDKLRIESNLLAAELPEILSEEHNEIAVRRINQIVNILSQLICKTVGTGSCQRLSEQEGES
ncbi:MAG: hypothetical protein SOR91_07300 [Hornefia butyriciproducens]|uniref:hypothetical protein n=1 Tax=Hornefia butyriciproducens TaxID=2652293 RepID=UPI002A75F1C4|nr:hypothetical protein [Hornefia butyriciproducens]MCI7327795.1 hypothetical protein [Clostridiales bacterium]MDY2991256.1 hypothetical protein [Hornefia butyriciproducens]